LIVAYLCLKGRLRVAFFVIGGKNGMASPLSTILSHLAAYG